MEIKTGDEVKGILYEIYNKYTHLHDKNKSIYVAFNEEGEKHVLLYTNFIKSYMNSISSNKTYEISKGSSYHVLKINEIE